MFELKVKLTITEINKFYRRDIDVTTLGDSKKQSRSDYIFVIGKERETGTYFHINFTDFDTLFCPCNRVLTCDKKYIDENFTETTLSDIQDDLR